MLAIFMKELPLRRWGPAAQSADAPSPAARAPGTPPVLAKSDSEA